ncbi:MAG: ABC transporter permease subunit [Marinosulfonomonas sp.]|nr:ABC transporter permease subunit [Marinosulfonomonas sp.]
MLTTPTRVRAFSLFAIWLLWEVNAQIGWLVPEVFTPTSQILAGLAEISTSPVFYEHMFFTILSTGVGFLIAVFAGTILGIGMGAFRIVGRALNPYIAALASSPKIIFLPVVMSFAGWGTETKMTMAVIGAIFPILLSAYAGMLSINPVHIRVAKSFNIKWYDLITKVYLPSLRHPLLVGFRLGFGASLVSVVLTEAKFGESGLGFLAMQYYGLYAIGKMFSVLVILFALAIIANFLLDRFATRVPH